MRKHAGPLPFAKFLKLKPLMFFAARMDTPPSSQRTLIAQKGSGLDDAKQQKENRELRSADVRKGLCAAAKSHFARPMASARGILCGIRGATYGDVWASYSNRRKKGNAPVPVVASSSVRGLCRGRQKAPPEFVQKEGYSNIGARRERATTGFLSMNFQLELLLCLGIVLIFGRAWRGPWLFDDVAILDETEEFETGYYFRPHKWWFTFKHRPAVYFLYQLTYTVVGFRMEVWHGINLVMHGAAVILLHRLVLVWGLGPSWAAGAAAVFAFHPLQVASVCYLSGRPGTQSMLFTLAGLFAFHSGAWLAAAGFQVIAWKSKEDSILLLAFYPISVFLFG